MKKHKLMILIFSYTFFSFIAFSQDTSKSIIDTIFVGLTTYPYAYNLKLSNGNIAIGPSVFMNVNKLTIQLSIMEDLKTYKTYQYTHFNTYYTGKAANFFLPILFHYNYITSNKLNCFATAGIILGGRNYLDEDNITRQTNAINFIGGAGCSYKILKKLVGRLSATIRYSEKIIFPGLLFDLIIPIKIKLNKNDSQ